MFSCYTSWSRECSTDGKCGAVTAVTSGSRVRPPASERAHSTPLSFRLRRIGSSANSTALYSRRGKRAYRPIVLHCSTHRSVYNKNNNTSHNPYYICSLSFLSFYILYSVVSQSGIDCSVHNGFKAFIPSYRNKSHSRHPFLLLGLLLGEHRDRRRSCVLLIHAHERCFPNAG